jgi:hypothetical protein
MNGISPGSARGVKDRAEATPTHPTASVALTATAADPAAERTGATAG